MTDRQAAFPYSPERRTAIVLCGTGAHGAYHAGVLRALHEAGVKIDVLAGQGIGAAGAALAALDGAGRLWEPGGLWRHPATPALYGWKRPVRAAAWLGVLLAGIVALPLLILVAGLLVQLAAFLIGMFGAEAGAALGALYAGWIAALFAPGGLPALLPPLALVVVALLVLVVAIGGLHEWWRAPARRRSGAWWWRLPAAPLDAESARESFLGAIRDLLHGGAAADPGGRAALGRRYAEVVSENLGHPGFRELILVASDLDARCDLAGVLLRDPYRRHRLARAAAESRADVIDLTGTDVALELVAAATTPPLACDPHLVSFAPESFWRGETHRLCDRPASIVRLLEEVAAAGVTQAVVVSAVAPEAAPHRLRPPRLDLRSRLGEVLAADTSAALRDAIELARARFDAVYVICPGHNPVGAFDLGGAYDEASDRWHSLEELMDRGYEDTGRQFIEPVVGASGEQLDGAGAPRAREPEPYGRSGVA